MFVALFFLCVVGLRGSKKGPEEREVRGTPEHPCLFPMILEPFVVFVGVNRKPVDMAFKSNTLNQVLDWIAVRNISC